MWSSPSDEVVECLTALQAETDLQIQQDSDMSGRECAQHSEGSKPTRLAASSHPVRACRDPHRGGMIQMRCHSPLSEMSEIAKPHPLISYQRVTSGNLPPTAVDSAFPSQARERERRQGRPAPLREANRCPEPNAASGTQAEILTTLALRRPPTES